MAASGKLWPARVTEPPAVVSLLLDSEGEDDGEVLVSSEDPESESSPEHAVATKRVPTERTAAR